MCFAFIFFMNKANFGKSPNSDSKEVIEAYGIYEFVE